jgi:hypothetical protein
MNLGDRLRLVRGADTQKAFAATLGVHENSVANAERRGSATQDYLLRIAEVRHINLHWLLTGQGAMRLEEPAGSLLQEKISLALTDALRLAYGARYAPCRSTRGPAPCAQVRPTCARSGCPRTPCPTPRRSRSSSGSPSKSCASRE